MEGGGDTPPFWLQTPTTLSRAHHHHRRSSSLFLNPGVLIVLLPIIALFLMFFVIPSFLSFTAQIFRPNLVKKSWDSVNLLLVLFAIFCGFLSRRNDDGTTNIDEGNNVTNVAEEVDKPNQSTPHQWYEYSDRRMYNSIQTSGGLKRNSSSYPDLRQESLWVSDEDRWRFFDDTQVNGYQLSGSDGVHHRPRRPEPQVDDSVIKNIPVDTFVVRRTESSSSSSYTPPLQSPQPPQPPAPPPPPPHPPSAVQSKPRRTFETQAHKKRVENPRSNEVEFKKIRRPPPPPSPPPPPPPPPPRAEQKSGKSDTKKGSATKDIGTVLASLYHQRKKKKKQKSKGNYDSTLYSPPSSSLHSGPPPPPPPPPPPSVFHNLFSYKKSNKSKKIHSIPATNPPPPPPPPPPPLVSSSRSSKQKTQIPPPSISPTLPPPSDTSRHRKPVAAGRPPLPTRINSFNEGDENLNSGCQSPLIPMPPPPPPFRMPDLKFVVRGDYARLRSSHSSRSSSPDLDSVDFSSSKESTTTPSEMDGGDATPSIFCPSPDVNTKADTFIARFRAGLKLEKMNSVKEKQEMGNSGSSPKPI